MFSKLSDKELVVLWHKLNMTNQEFEDYILNKDWVNKRIVEINKEIDFSLWHIVSKEVSRRGLDPNSLTKTIKEDI